MAPFTDLLLDLSWNKLKLLHKLVTPPHTQTQIMKRVVATDR